MNVMQSLVKAAVPAHGQTVMAGQCVNKTVGGVSVVPLEGDSFSITAGPFVTLVGPSGCGNSTLVRLIAGLIDRSSDSLTVHRHEVGGPHTDIGMTFQRLLEWQTVIETVLLPVELRRTVTPADKARAAELLAMVG